MTKWADNLISAVRYGNDETHIEKVRVHVDNGDSVGAGYEKSRSEVVTLIEGGSTFATIFKNGDKWTFGSQVEIVTVNGVKYIRTNADRETEDNLENLPRF